jgi:hypothetical protein
MAHPHRKEAADGHNAKLKRMTEDYGLASGPANNLSAPPNALKPEGDEKPIGFGTDSTAPRGRFDRAGRNSPVATPVSTLKHGGHAKHKRRAAGGKVEVTGEGPAGRYDTQGSVLNRARGGRKGHGKGATVNVLVAPQHGAGGPGGPPVVPVPPVAGGMPPVVAVRPPGPPMGAGPMPGGPIVPPGPVLPGPVAPGAPGGIPPGMLPPRKHGGAVGRKHGGGLGHFDPTGSHGGGGKRGPDGHFDPTGSRKSGGRVEDSVGGSGEGDTMMAHSRKEQGLKPPMVASDGALGGRHMPKHHHLTAGAATGVARLEKMGMKPRHDHRKQVV